MIADAKLNGSVAKGIIVAHYMLNPDAKIDDADVKNMQKGGGNERILHIERDHAQPVLINGSPKASAQSFISQVTNWNKRNRPGKKMPKSHWEHRVVSFHPDDSKKLNAQTACRIARESLNIVTSGERPTLYVVHGDTEHLHVHMLYATVDETGKIHNPHQDYCIWEQAMQSLEIKYDLYRVEKRTACAYHDPSRAPDGTNPAKCEFRMIQRTEGPSCKQQLRQLLDQAIDDSKSAHPAEKFARFITSLQSQNIGITANLQTTGRVVGLRLHYGIFSKGGIKASALGKNYSWSKLALAVDFDKNTNFNTHLLKVSDHRAREWINHEDGGKEYASQIIDNTQSPTRKISTQTTKATTASSSALMVTPEFPVNYPEYLKEFIRAIIRAANAEMRSQQQKNNQLSHSVDIIVKLLESLQKRAIKNHLKHNKHRATPTRAGMPETSRHADYESSAASSGLHNFDRSS